jgi:stalled ribosome rescue protein Dom34
MNRVGLWIDHARAVLVSLDDEGEVTTRTVKSDAGKRVRSKGGARSSTVYGPQDATYEARRDRKYEHRLEQFYASVGQLLADSDSIFILGPGEAKTEFRKHLETSGVPAERLSVEAADKLTEAQIVEKVKTRFGYPTRETF